MSMNISIRAEREIVIKKTGKETTQVEYFKAVQTPTEVTYRIYGSEDPINAYKDYIVFNYYHLKDFDAWVKEVTDKGYKIKFGIV